MSMTDELKVAARIAGMLSDPCRLQMLQSLTWGPCSVAELVELTGSSQSNVSNHLRNLRDHSLVEAEKIGRLVFYRVSSPAVAEVISSLSWAATGSANATTMQTPEPLRTARACYDHLAGDVGVRVFKGLVKHGGLTEAKFPWAEVEMGPNAEAVFGRLGVDLAKLELNNGYRRLAFGCPDWSEQGQSHIGGHIGAFLFKHFLAQGWLQTAASRAVKVTESGKRALGWLIGTSEG
ncbi:metalloregulator ArsR/SmtB family transcription factor [Agrobacterium vitis]|uniref:Metalloregulator ArsR/SmtB family transcription factor n=2 Tax=Agrobacterium vitis TaxID=373 RepID=A0AAE5AV28_AGRVI|nr:winged helix-turn-helix transcriptional regulator [Allorhizobium sp. Av2]MUZ56961.1 metalloregulator ArsR/SmtB family transcription factor [Agrobacterium vitis]MVA69139.1 metalloregulator ArsR/SmtB family transcription factor [Agrobacterium vitis]MVA85903.1 metalloregulator ArsR/SmtB family transcription factor [Agrobacterium vitis]